MSKEELKKREEYLEDLKKCSVDALRTLAAIASGINAYEALKNKS